MDEGLCQYSMTGVYAGPGIPDTPTFIAQCACGALVTIQNGRIPPHRPGEDKHEF